MSGETFRLGVHVRRPGRLATTTDSDTRLRRTNLYHKEYCASNTSRNTLRTLFTQCDIMLQQTCNTIYIFSQ